MNEQNKQNEQNQLSKHIQQPVESKPYMVYRVEAMVGAGAENDWNFSPADTDALKYVLKSREEALMVLRSLISQVHAVIAEVEGK